jgi:hypothetical protein
MLGFAVALSNLQTANTRSLINQNETQHFYIVGVLGGWHFALPNLQILISRISYLRKINDF